MLVRSPMPRLAKRVTIVVIVVAAITAGIGMTYRNSPAFRGALLHWMTAPAGEIGRSHP